MYCFGNWKKIELKIYDVGTASLWGLEKINYNRSNVSYLHYAALNSRPFILASKSALSHYWEHYCRHYANPIVKDYILALVHETLLNNLPWNNFFPGDSDLRLMVSVIDSFLPLCHEFLGRIFVEIPWAEIFRRNPYSLPRSISPLLHIAVKLAAEPQVRLVSFYWSYIYLKDLNIGLKY